MRNGCESCRQGQAFELPFSMAFQPIVDIRKREVFAFEALVRGINGEGAASVLTQVDPVRFRSAVPRQSYRTGSVIAQT